ncbi:TRP-domain-containing protein, partial [Aureobasidium melanogenum]
SSAVNVTRFDAAYYKDNMTVLFHLAGNTAIANESLMMYIGVYAYGQGRFDLTFDPCNANIASLCPLNASIPIEANGIIPVAQSDVAAIPPIALSIPDFEGEAILRIFANSTQAEIGCYSAVVTNGATFSQPKAVGSILGIFTVIALIASFATAIYGDSVPVMRKHYAHSLSVLVVFSVFQHVFFTGALSMNWPSVLVAWWSNFAWSGGMIYSSSMQHSIDKLIGNNLGNTSQVGAAGSGTNQDGVGGGFDISSIYRRGLSIKRDVAWDIYQRDHSIELRRDVLSRTF